VTRLVPSLVLLLVALAACSHDGRALRPAGPDQTASLVTTTTVPTATTRGPSVQPGVSSGRDAQGGSMSIVTPWPDGGAIAPQFTCKGADTSPAISWSGVPSAAKELALAFTDLDADGFVHWLVAGISPSTTGVAAGQVPAGAIQGTNGFNLAAYSGPCPPDGRHTYLVTLYALGQPSGLTTGVDGQKAVDTLESDQILSVAISGVFG
jgi:Raf kinase inhibitor-like YbhB/YbcL family protein